LFLAIQPSKTLASKLSAYLLNEEGTRCLTSMDTQGYIMNTLWEEVCLQN